MKVYEAVAQTLVDQGVRDVFGLMGDGNLKLIPHLTSAHGVRMLSARHESAALAMADGYARMTGQVGVCTVTQGPGLTNTLTALVSARKAGTPLVLLAGDTPLGVKGLPQDCDQDAVFAAAGVPVQPFHVATAAGDVAAAFQLARSTPGPVGLSMPTDLQDEGFDGELPGPGRTAGQGAATAPATIEPDAAQLAEAVAALRGAQRPVVLAGRGAIRAGAHAEAIALADQMGALLATSLPGKSWFDDHPWSLGICGGFATPLGVELLHDADVVVVLGASLNSFTSKAGTLLRSPTRVVHVDAQPTAIGAFTPAAVGVVGDARVTAERLRAALAADGGPATGYRTPEVRARLDAFDLGAAHEDRSSAEEGLDPRSVCAVLDRVLPRDRSVVTDGGHFCGFPAAYLTVPEPSAFAFSLDFGSVGLGLGTAMGAAVGRPDRLMVLAIGDGGLMMSLGEVDTAVRHRIPMLVLVFDDRAYGAEMHFLRMLDLPDEESLFETPDLAAVATAMGARGVRVDALADLEALGAACSDLDGPLVVHIPVNRDVRAGWLEEAFARTVGH